MRPVEPKLIALLQTSLRPDELCRLLQQEAWGVTLVHQLRPWEHSPPATWFHELAVIIERDEQEGGIRSQFRALLLKHREWIKDEIWAAMPELSTNRIAERSTRKVEVTQVPSAAALPPSPGHALQRQGESSPQLREGGVVRVLHLSDLHFSAKTAWDSGPVLQRLAGDVAKLREEVQEIDLVVVTGDIANSGDAKEYVRAAAWLTGPLAKAAGVTNAQIRVVPGNHDVQRKKINTAAQAWVTSVGGKSDPQQDIADVLSHRAKRRSILARQADYIKFARTFHPELEVPWWSERIDIRGLKLHIAGFNSAWCSASDADRGHLLLSRWQCHLLLAHSDDADLTIALMHHPWDYLVEFDKHEVEEGIRRRCGVILHGHLHEQKARISSDPDHDVLQLAAGASYADSKWSNSYQLLELDPIVGTARVHFRVWDGYDWIPDRNRYQKAPDGVACVPLRRSARAQLAAPVSFNVPDQEFLVRYIEFVKGRSLAYAKPLLPPSRSCVSLDVELKLRAKHCAAPVTLSDALRSLPKEKRWVIRGPAGSGKTYMLIQQVLRLAEQAAVNGVVPIYLHYRDIRSGLQAAVNGVVSRLGLGDWLWTKVCAGTAVVLIDHVPSDRDDQEIVDAVLSAAFSAGASSVIIATRDGTNVEKPGSFVRLDLEELEDLARGGILNAWLGSDDSVEQVLMQIGSESRLLHFLERPLTLVLMASVATAYEIDDLPRTRVDLYQRYLNVLLRQEHQGLVRGLRLDISILRDFELVAAFIALVVHRERGECDLGLCWDRIRENNDIMGALERVLKAAQIAPGDLESFVTLLYERTGLAYLDPVGPGKDPKIRFASPAMEEYLAAIALRESEEMRAWLSKGQAGPIVEQIERHPSQWAEVLALFACGSDQDVHILLLQRVAALSNPKLTRAIICRMERVDEQVSGAYLNASLSIASACAGRSQYDAIFRSGDTPDDMIDLFLRMATNHTGGDERYWIFHFLRRLASSKELEQSARHRSGVAALRVATGARPRAREDALRALNTRGWSPVALTPSGAASPATVVEASALITNAVFRLFDPDGVLAGSEDEPVTTVSWCQAVMFAMWLDMRLPRVAECEAVFLTNASDHASHPPGGEWTSEIKRDYPEEVPWFDGEGPWEGCGLDTRVCFGRLHNLGAGAKATPAPRPMLAESKYEGVGFRVLRPLKQARSRQGFSESSA